jgi:hypothetical protein
MDTPAIIQPGDVFTPDLTMCLVNVHRTTQEDLLVAQDASNGRWGVTVGELILSSEASDLTVAETPNFSYFSCWCSLKVLRTCFDQYTWTAEPFFGLYINEHNAS